jgi:hypothetical protein
LDIASQFHQSISECDCCDLLDLSFITMVTAHSLVSDAAAKWSENVATVFDDGDTVRLLTYGELIDQARQVSDKYHTECTRKIQSAFDIFIILYHIPKVSVDASFKCKYV